MKKGFTLVELIVIIALFAVVMSVGMSFLIGSKESFERSQEASEIHGQVRRASDYIRDEVRNAVEISLEALPLTVDITYEYLYVENGYLVHVEGGVSETLSSDILIDNISMFSISQTNNGRNVLNYTIEAFIDSNVGDRSYDAATSVHLNNIQELLGTKNSAYADVVNQCIKYKNSAP